MKKALVIILTAVFVFFAFPLASFSSGATNDSLEDYPEIARIHNINEKGHVRRLASEERSMSSLVYENEDGSRTIYMFCEDIKFEDSSGNIVDKSNRLILSDRQGYKYENEANTYKCYIPETITSTNGILVEYGDASISIYKNGTPIRGEDVQVNESDLTHSNEISIVPDFSSIRIEESFSVGQGILVDTEKAISSENDNTLYFTDITNEDVSRLETNTIQTNTNLNDSSAEISTTSGQSYVITVGSSNEKPIVDAILDPLAPSIAAGGLSEIGVGKNILNSDGSLAGQLKSLMAFPGYFNLGISEPYSLKTANLILTVSYTDVSNTIFDAYHNGGATWNEETVTYENYTVQNGDAAFQHYASSISENATISMDIKPYIYNVYSAIGTKGIILSANDIMMNNDQAIYMYSTESNRASYRPYLVVETYPINAKNFLFKVTGPSGSYNSVNIYLYPNVGSNVLGPFRTDKYGVCAINLCAIEGYTYSASHNYCINYYKQGYQLKCKPSAYTETGITPGDNRILLAMSTSNSNQPTFTKPLDSTITSSISGGQNYGWRYCGGRDFHDGADISSGYSFGSNVFAAASGTVVNSGWDASMGYYVKISHSINNVSYYTTYMHMAYPPLVSVNSTVSAGTQLGFMGSTGNSTGVHLHFQVSVWNSSQNKYVTIDPYAFVSGTYNN